LQNILKVAKCSGPEPRNKTGRKEYKSRISNATSHKTSGIKSIHICNDPASAKIQKRIEEYISTSKSSNIITTSYYRVLEMVR
jgi:hypothetical protein